MADAFKFFRSTLRSGWVFVLMIALSGCWVDPNIPEFPVGEVMGYMPVYITDAEASIAMLPPQPLVKPGKIYSSPPYLLVNELSRGVHIFNNSDPSKPFAIAFLRVPGNVEITLRGSTMYVNHLTDLVALDVRDWQNVKELSRHPQEHWNQLLPPEGSRYFECVDRSKGIVLTWELTSLKDPKCFR